MKQCRLHLIVAIILPFLLISPAHLVLQGFGNRIIDLVPDMIIHNGPILTMEQSPTQVEAVAIQGESILAIGDETEILGMAGSNTRIVNLGGRTLLPGFIDSHSHWINDRESVNQSTAEEAIESVLSSGWTSISELFVNQELLDELITLDQQDSLRVRVNAYLPLNYQFDRFGNWYQSYQPGQEFSSKLRIGGAKLFMDGWVTNWNHYFIQTELDTLVLEAHEAGFQIAIHSVTDNSTDIVLNSFESALGGESNQLRRHRIEHCVLLRDDQIERMSNLGIIASFQLPWFDSDFRSLETFPLYQEYSHLIARWQDILQANIPSLGSTDFPYVLGDSGSAMKAISSAVTRIGEQGLTPTDWMLNQSLSVEQALRLLTIDGAYGTFQESLKGSIKVGKLADLVILSDNPLTVLKSHLADIEVLVTMVGGKIEYVKEGSEFIGLIIPPPPLPLLLALVFIPIVAVLVLLIVRKKRIRINPKQG